jgi:hypothetical protein
MLRKIIYIYRASGKAGHQTEEEKRQIGLDYVEKLKDEFNVVEVKDENKQFIVYIEDGI